MNGQYPHESDDGLLLGDSWAEFFADIQKPKQNHSDQSEVPQSSDNTASLQPKQEEGGGKGSLMTPSMSQVQSVTGVTDNKQLKVISKVNSVRAYVPEGLSLPDDCKCKEQIWYFLGLIYWKHLERRETWDTPIRLKYDYLKQNIPNWSDVWKSCEGWLVSRTGYTPGERSCGYWTEMPYQEQTHRLRTFEHKLLAKRLHAIQTKHRSRPIMVHLRKQLERLSVNMDEFTDRFSTHPNRRYYEAHLRTILDGEIRLTKDDFSGRLHSNVSNMFKPLRGLLRVDSDTVTLGETDIKNSQPLFLGLAAKEKGFEDKKYIELCEQGLIYDHLARKLGVLRESAKHEMVMLFFAKNGFKSTAKSVFEYEFPRTAAYICSVKKKDYKRLSRQMQTAERRFVIDTVCERLKRLRPHMFMTTIHDAILARQADCDLVVAVMKEEFANRGINPRLEWQDVRTHMSG